MKDFRQNKNGFVNILDQLQSLSLFAGLPEGTLNHFAEKSFLKEGGKGKILFLQGDNAEWFYIIIHGWVKLFRESSEGAEAIIDIVNTGSVFGEDSVFDDNLYNYSAEIIDSTQYIMMPTSLLRYHIEKNQQMAINMLSSMSRQRKQQNRDIEHLNIQNAPQRIGCFLLRLCADEKNEPVEIHLPYDKTLIAARLGMKAETFSRALAKLKKDVNLSIKGSTVQIHNLQQLIEYTCHHCSHSFVCDDMTVASAE